MSPGGLSVDSGNQEEWVDDILNAIVAPLTAKDAGRIHLSFRKNSIQSTMTYKEER